MTGPEYVAAIEKLGMTRSAAAQLFGVNVTTARRWVGGEHPIPRSVEVALKLMLRYNLTPAGVETILKKAG